MKRVGEKPGRRGLVSDFREFDFGNTDEKKVLEARVFSAYKRRFVIRCGGPGGRSFSIGVLFISSKLEAGDGVAADIVRHEYGHTEQLKRLGLFRYLRAIAWPSMRSRKTGVEYFSQPWEVTADMYGGVEREHLAGAEERGLDWLTGIRSS